LDTFGLAKYRDQNSGDQGVRLFNPDCILSRFGPSRDHVVVNQELGETPGGRAARGTDRDEQVNHRFEWSLRTAITGRLKNARKAALSEVVASGIWKPSQLDRLWNAGLK
jgi:hypothetical protein